MTLRLHRRIMQRILALAIVLLASTAMAAEPVSLLPGPFTLSGPHARQRLVLEETAAGQFVGQVGDGVTFTSSDPKIVEIDAGVALPRANGRATITAAAGER